MNPLSLACFLALATLCSFSTAAEAKRCGDSSVSVGQSSFEIRALCGAPVHVDHVMRAQASQVASLGEYGNPLGIGPVERWTYVFSKEEFVVSMEFANGVLVSLEHEGKPPSGTGSLEQCRSSVHSNGDTLAEVLLRCGSPADSIRWGGKRYTAGANAFSRQHISAIHDRWTYNFGPQEFLLMLTFENGRLTGQSTGGYGF